MGKGAYEKYVRLKERQRKLKILRQKLFNDDPDYPVLSEPGEPRDYHATQKAPLTSLYSYPYGSVYIFPLI